MNKILKVNQLKNKITTKEIDNEILFISMPKESNNLLNLYNILKKFFLKTNINYDKLLLIRNFRIKYLESINNKYKKKLYNKILQIQNLEYNIEQMDNDLNEYEKIIKIQFDNTL